MKKVSTKTLESLIKEKTDSVPKTVSIKYNLSCDAKDIVFNVKTSLSIAERTTFISRVCNSILFDNEYHIEYFEPLFDITLIQMLTDIPVFQDGENLNMDKTIELCKALDIRSSISSALTNDIGFVLKLHNDCKDVLEFKKQQVIAQTSSVSDEVLENVNCAIVKFNKVLDSIKSAVENMDMSKGKEIIDTAINMNKAGLNDSIKNVDAILKYYQKNASTQNIDKNEQNKVENEQKDNLNVIPLSPTEE